MEYSKRSMKALGGHASIAGYSTGIPTLVVGYSIKSKGIGKDIGMERWVIPIEDSDVLPQKTGELWAERSAIGAQLKKRCSVLCGAKERSM